MTPVPASVQSIDSGRRKLKYISSMGGNGKFVSHVCRNVSEIWGEPEAVRCIYC